MQKVLKFVLELYTQCHVFTVSYANSAWRQRADLKFIKSKQSKNTKSER